MCLEVIKHMNLCIFIFALFVKIALSYCNYKLHSNKAHIPLLPCVHVLFKGQGKKKIEVVVAVL